MTTRKTAHEEKRGGAPKVAAKGEKLRKEAEGLRIHFASLFGEGSWERVAMGVGAAAGGGLLAAALVGVGPAALAGAAGYLAYRGLIRQQRESPREAHQRGHG